MMKKLMELLGREAAGVKEVEYRYVYLAPEWGVAAGMVCVEK